MRFYYLLLLLAATLSATAQVDRLPLIHGVMALRHEWFTDKGEQLYAFSKMQESWAHAGITKEDFETIFYNYWRYTISPKVFRRRLSKKYPVLTDDLLTDENYHTYRTSSNLVELMYEGVITPVWPYKISSGGGLIAEFGYYGLKDGMRLAEIGAGYGFASMLVASSFNDVELYVNELRKGKVRRIDNRFRETRALSASNTVTVVEGEAKDCAIPGNNLDLIFVRETFHHFKFKTEMLASIRQKLAPSGRLVIRERLKGYTTCGAATTRDEILRIVTANGFSLVQEVELEQGNILLTFQPTPSEK